MYQPTPQPPPTTSTQNLTPQTQTPPPRPSSHQSGPITHHWNDLPASILLPQKSYSTSTSRSTSPLPPPSNSHPPNADTDAGADKEAQLQPLIEKLFSAPSDIPDTQRRQLKEKVLKALPGMSPGQRGEVVGILARWEGDGGKREGREAVVGFMVRERGVAGWAMCLRRGFEGLV